MSNIIGYYNLVVAYFTQSIAIVAVLLWLSIAYEFQLKYFPPGPPNFWKELSIKFVIALVITITLATIIQYVQKYTTLNLQESKNTLSHIYYQY
jgi:hypothetical protein